MVIRRMNNVFTRHGRWLFGLITLAIIVSFVGFLSPGFSGILDSVYQKDTVGTVFGNKVTFNDVRAQANRNLIAYSLIFGTGLNNSGVSDLASKNAFPAICRLAAAERRGIVVSDKQVVDYISTLPIFKDQKTGKFNLEQYRKYINDTLRPNGFSAADLDQSVREFLIQRQLDEELRDGTVVTSGEVEQFFNQFSEKIQVRVARFNAKDYINKVKLTDAANQAYFETNHELYIIPANFQALLIAFPYNAPEVTKEATAGITEEAMKQYYEENKNQFMVFKAGQEPKTIPFAKAQNDVRKKLLNKLCRDLAFRKAQLFAQEVYDKVGEAAGKKLDIFKQTAAKYNLNPVLTPWFTERDDKVGAVESKALVEQLATVYDAVPVSNAVAANQAAYVGFIVKKIVARPAKYQEVKAQVLAKVKEIEAMKAARQAAREIVAKLSKMNKAQRMKVALSLKSPKFDKMDQFMAANPPYGNDGRLIASISEDLLPGDISPATDTASGALVVLVEKKILPSKADFKKSEQQVNMFYHQRKFGAASAAFASWLDSKCKKVK
jgi:hypothetical protein